jgi:predicted metalloprotease with PDZ domain
MMIIAHEQFHQLVDLSRGDLPSPSAAVWFNESLAQYYGLKALSAADKSQDARDVWAEFIDPHRPVEHGLLELNRRYVSGDHAVYNLFYSEGATLWHAIDTAIATSTRGEKTLDDYLGDLLRAQIAEDGSLPNSLIDRLRSAGGASVDQAMSKYLGE